MSADGLHRKQACRDDIWHLDEVGVAIVGCKHWLWWTVDQDGYVLDELVDNGVIPKPSSVFGPDFDAFAHIFGIDAPPTHQNWRRQGD